MIDETRAKEMVDIFEDILEAEQMKKDIEDAQKIKIKEAKTIMKDWAQRNELDPKVVAEVYKDYKTMVLNPKDDDDTEYAALFIAMRDLVKSQDT